MEPLLTIQALEKSFRLHEQSKRIPSCLNVNLQVFPGQLTALTGPTGAGKSSVLKCVYRSYLPSSGRILLRGVQDVNGRVEDIDLVTASDTEILALRESDIGFVTQFLHCLPRKTALQIVSQPLLKKGTSQREAEDKAGELLQLLNVPQRLWAVPPATFSGGEKQRINLARGLIARPRLLLLDEPTASLDAATTDRVVELLQMIKEEGVAMLAIFHHAALVSRLADHVVELEQIKTLEASLEPMQ